MRVWGIIVIYFLPALLFGQGSEELNSDRFRIYLEKYLKTNDAEEVRVTNFIPFVDKLETKKEVIVKDSEFLRVLFNKVHKKFLKNYSDYVPFSALFSSGTYNCLTATALYALLLDHFDYDYHVVETNYHIFLLIKTENGRVLLETTDPQYGYIDNEKRIEEKIQIYRENRIAETSSRKLYYHFQFDLYNEVDLNGLTGLLYYNLAIDAFNENKIDQCVNLLGQATGYYKSKRIEEFSRVILLTLLHSDLEATTKQTYLNKVKSLKRLATL